MCIHHFTYHVPCGHYLPNRTHSINTHCTSLQHALFHYHDQHDLTINSTLPAPSSPLSPPHTCPPIPPLSLLPTLTPRTAAYVSRPSILPHPSPAAERRAYQAWGRFHSRDELNYFFFLASGLLARRAGRYHEDNLPAPPPPPTPDDEPTMGQLAARYEHPDGSPNVQITPVPFGCGQGRSGPCQHLHRRRATDTRGFSEGELERAVEEEERIATHRARRDWLAEEMRQNELVQVGGGMVVMRRHLPGFFGGVVAQGGDVVGFLRGMAEGGRGLVNGVGRRYYERRRYSCPEMEMERADGRGRSYSV
jgi:hypothetical protein